MRSFLKWTAALLLLVVLPWFALANYTLVQNPDGSFRIRSEIGGFDVLRFRRDDGIERVEFINSAGLVLNQLNRWCGVAYMSDVTTVTTASIASPVTGQLAFVETVLHSTIQGSNAVLTVRINGTSAGTITVTASGSRWGDVDNLTGGFSTTAVSRGNYITVTSDGGPANDTIPLTATICIDTR